MTDYKAKHTPGPWKVGYFALDVTAEDHKGTFKVCDIRGWGHFTGSGHGALGLSHNEGKAIQEANAHLIAAAPDMLAALRAISQLGHDKDLPDAWEIASAAIKKVTGGEHG